MLTCINISFTFALLKTQISEFLTLRKDKYIFWKNILFGRFYFTKNVYSYYQILRWVACQYVGHSSKHNAKARHTHQKANILQSSSDNHTARWLSLNLGRNRRKYVKKFYKWTFRITSYVSTLYKTYCFAFQKRRFCTVKAAVLQRKTYAFATPNRNYRFSSE